MIIQKGILHSPDNDEWLTAWEGMFTYAFVDGGFTDWDIKYSPGEWTDDCIVIIPGELL